MVRLRLRPPPRSPELPETFLMSANNPAVAGFFLEPLVSGRRIPVVEGHFGAFISVSRETEAGPSQRPASYLDSRQNVQELDRLTEAFLWDRAPRDIIRVHRIYRTIVTRRLRAIGVRDKPTVPASPWQNGFAERLIGSIRRECADHFIVFGEAHLRRILQTYAGYCDDIRTHRSLD